MNTSKALVFSAVTALLAGSAAQANPVGGNVKSGSASFSRQGGTLNVTTSDRALINWQSFNIGVGETTRFLQPSASSVVWNQISDANPSRILGNLTANGLVVLQNQAGFFVGGQAAISVGGLVMTTSPILPPELASGGLWEFNGPPPAASVINYGQISAGPGGSVFLIARDVQNRGTIEAPGGKVGLYAGKEVMVSQSPDGRGLAARVTLPQGSVDNSGRIIADAGTIAMHAETVNVGGLVQADSVRTRNGVIELVASDALKVAPSAVISAKGGSEGPSAGGSVLIKSDGTYTDDPTAAISVAGGAQGGAGGQVEVSAPQMSAILSRIDGGAAAGWSRGNLLIDPLNIVLESSGTPASSGTIDRNDQPGQTLRLDPASFASFAQISLQAGGDITLNSAWSLADSVDPASTLSLQAGKNINLNKSLTVGRNWSVDLVAGADFASAHSVVAAIGGIYLNAGSALQAQNGSISLTAGKEIILTDVSTVSLRAGGVRTLAGGSIEVTALSGDVVTGSNPKGYIFSSQGAGYDVSKSLGGISTAAGGDVKITAGRDVIIYLPTGSGASQTDGGSGAFGPQPGVVTVTAGRNVSGHFVAANSQRNGQDVASTITALNGDAGSYGSFLALSLVKGGWEVNAPNGRIYLQEVRNPNGLFNRLGGATTPTRHRFDYDDHAFVDLSAREVHLTGQLLPRLSGENIPVIYPPSLSINAGSGGITLGNNLILFPSPNGELDLATTAGGSFQTDQAGVNYSLTMSDSGRKSWVSEGNFTFTDHADYPVQFDNPNPVTIDISGNLRDILITAPKQARIAVGGDMINATFYGQNLHASDVTSIDVVGKIWNRNDWTFAYLGSSLPKVSLNPNLPPDYFQVLSEAVFPSGLPVFANLPFVYDAATQRLGFNGRMSLGLEALLLTQTFQVKTYAPDGTLLRDTQGNLITRPATFALDPAVIRDIFARSQDVPARSGNGYQLGGSGQFNISAASLDLGVTAGIVSEGPALNYALAKLPDGNRGASINIDLGGDLDMYSSTISSIFGGDIHLVAGGAINLGSQELLSGSTFPRGILTSGPGDISVIAGGDINIQGSRIAAYSGGDILVRSLEGDVNAGSGGSTQVRLTQIIVDPVTKAVTLRGQPIAGSGILATTLPNAPISQTVGNIQIETPRGNIVASDGGIVQDPLNGNRSLSPTVTLTAGTRDENGQILYTGNIDAGKSGVIGVNTTLNAAGNITGLVVASGNANINAAANVTGTFFAAGTANFNAGGNVSGTVIAGQGISSGGGTFSATALSQNVTVGGAKADSALASSATAGATSQAAAQTSTQEAEKTIAQATLSGDDDDTRKKKSPLPLLKRASRVTVILPPS